MSLAAFADAGRRRQNGEKFRDNRPRGGKLRDVEFFFQIHYAVAQNLE